MLLTPRIVRAHQVTQQDVSPIHIGTPRTLGITGPPPTIAPAPNVGAARTTDPPAPPPTNPSDPEPTTEPPVR